MSAKQVLDGINTIRDLVNHPNLSDAEKVATLKNAVEEVRNNVQDLVTEIYADFVPEIQKDATADEEESAYEVLKLKDVNDLLFFYKRSVFVQIPSAPARLALARILLRIMRDKEMKAPALWESIAASAGEINEE